MSENIGITKFHVIVSRLYIKGGSDFNNAYVLIENNDVGQQVVDVLHQELEYENIFSTVQEKNKQYVSPGLENKLR